MKTLSVRHASRWLLSLIGLCLALWAPASAALTLRVCQADPARYAYRNALLQLLLDKTAKPGEDNRVQPFAAGTDPAQDRCLELLRQGQVDVLSLPPSTERTQGLLVIPIDIMQGLLGYRLLLVHRDRLSRFAQVNSLAELRALTGGFGRQWSDYAVFDRNQLPVVGANSSAALMAMLEAGRFDYFHRGLHEAWAELAQRSPLSPLTIEPHLALHYPLPVYLTLDTSARELRDRLQRGLQRAMADGSFRALFLRHYEQLIRRTQLTQRTLIELAPALPTPAEDTPPWWR